MAILGQAKLNSMRVNAARLDFYRPLSYLTLNGTQCERQVRKATVRIEKFNSSTAAAQGQLNRMVFRMGAGAVTPAGFMDVKFYSGSTAPSSLQFGGTIQKVTQTIEGKAANAAFDVEAVGYGWLFNRQYVSKTYTAMSATAVILDLVTTFTTGTTTTHVEAGLPPISITFLHTLPLDALGQIAALVGRGTTGARFFIDDTNDLWFYTVERRASPETIIGLNPACPIAEVESITITHDQAQRRTRVAVRGGATATTAGAIVPAIPAIPITNAMAFDLGSGPSPAQVITPLGDVISYTGATRTGTVAAPTAAMAAGCQIASLSNTGSLTPNAAYRWAFTFVTSNGETTASPYIDGFVLAGNGSAVVDLSGLYTRQSLIGVLPPDPSITAINLYRTVANGTQLFFSQAIVAGATAWPATVQDSVADAALGGPPPYVVAPPVFCPQGQATTTSSAGAAAGATVINSVANCGIFDPGGGWATTGEVVFQYASIMYTGAGGNALVGNVTLAAPLLSPIAIGQTITTVPALTGCTAGVALAATPPVAEGWVANAPGVTTGTLYNWATTFVTAAGESLPGPLSGTYAKASPVAPGAPTLANNGTGVGPTNGGVYLYRVGVLTNQRMITPIGAVSASITSNGTGIRVTMPGGLPAGTIVLFRTKAGGSLYYWLTSVSGSGGGPFTDNNADTSLVTLETDFWTQKYTLSAIPVGPTGVTARKVYRNTGPGTALQLLTTIADNTTTTFEDTTADASLGAAAPSTDTAGVVGLPSLAAGQTLTAYALRDDLTQQSAIGVFEHYVTDPALLTINGPDAEATGQLAIRSVADDQITVTSRDAKIQPGVILPVNIGAPNNMSGAFVVQDVTITQFEAKTDGAPYLYPLIEARGGSARYVLEDFLWDVKRAVSALQ